MAPKRPKKVERAKTRRCPRCPKVGRPADHPLSDFSRNKATADGLSAYCRQCKREADRASWHGETGQPPEPKSSEQHPPSEKLGDARNSERQRAPALAISDEMIDRASDLIREIGATRRAAARHVGVSENTFKAWLKEAADLKDPEDPRCRLLFAIETAEGEAETALTRAYFKGTRIDPQVAQRFLERRFSRGDERWTRTEHVALEEEGGPMEADDARKAILDRINKLFGGSAPPPGDAEGSAGGARTGPAVDAAADAATEPDTAST